MAQAGGDNQMSDPVSVNKSLITNAFVSYAHQDATIAEMIEQQLTFLAERGQGKTFLHCFLDTKSIPKGQKYEPIIRSALKDADWLIVVFTGDQSVYCGYEIGLFSFIKPENDSEKPIVCLHDVDKSLLPAVVEGYNAAMVTAIDPYPTANPITAGEETVWWNSPVGLFLRDFCKTKSLYSPDLDNPGQFKIDIATAAKRIAHAFEFARQEDLKEETPVQAGFEIIVNPTGNDKLTRIPGESLLIGTSRAFDILGLNLALSPNSAPQISWADLRKALLPEDRANIPWMDKLEINVSLAADRKVPEPEDVTFKGRDGRIYRAILTRHQLYMNGKRKFFVLFVESFDRRFIGSQRSSLLLTALTLASRWRFTYFEKWQETLKKFDPSLSDNAFRDSCKQLEYNMEWIEHESVELGADDPSAMVAAFGFENKARVERFYTDWEKVKTAMKSELPQTFEEMDPATRAKAQKAIVTFLQSVKQQNAEFLELCVDAYRNETLSNLRKD
jgi:hypothetical protein